jgi:hypothetical protein
MDIEYARQLLAIYIENARRVLRAHFGVDRAERSFFNLIELLREETKLGPIFVQAVRDSFIEHDPRSYQDGVVPQELVEIATHELHWPKFGEIARERIKLIFHGDERLAASDPSISVLAAYSRAWEDREFYRRYQQPAET